MMTTSSFTSSSLTATPTTRPPSQARLRPAKSHDSFSPHLHIAESPSYPSQEHSIQQRHFPLPDCPKSATSLMSPFTPAFRTSLLPNQLSANISTPRLVLHPLRPSSFTSSPSVSSDQLDEWLQNFLADHPFAASFRHQWLEEDCQNLSPSCAWIIELKDGHHSQRQSNNSSPFLTDELPDLPVPDDEGNLAGDESDGDTEKKGASRRMRRPSNRRLAQQAAPALLIGVVELRFPPNVLQSANPVSPSSPLWWSQPTIDSKAGPANGEDASGDEGGSRRPSLASLPSDDGARLNGAASWSTHQLPDLPRLLSPHLATFLDPAYVGNGYSTEAVRATLLHIFSLEDSTGGDIYSNRSGRAVGASLLGLSIAASSGTSSRSGSPDLSRPLSRLSPSPFSSVSRHSSVLPPLKVLTSVNEASPTKKEAQLVLEKLGFEVASPSAMLDASVASLSLGRNGRAREVLWEVSRESFLELWSA